jgi:hypothetical protein
MSNSEFISHFELEKFDENMSVDDAIRIAKLDEYVNERFFDGSARVIIVHYNEGKARTILRIQDGKLVNANATKGNGDFINLLLLK